MRRAFPGVQTELDLQGAQGQGRLVELAVQAHGAIFAHGALQVGVKERVDIDPSLQWRRFLAASW